MKGCPAILLLVLLLSSPIFAANTKCITAEANFIRTFVLSEETRERDVTISIEVSDRISHQIISEIFRILIAEVVGYQNVVIKSEKYSNVTKTLQRITGFDSPTNYRSNNAHFIPSSMINLEAWLNPGYDLNSWVATGEVEDCGPLGPIGRAGWYVSKDLAFNTWKEQKIAIDHWRSFQKKEIASEFNLSKGVKLSIYTQLFNSTKHYCNERGICQKGIYKPIWCQGQGLKHKCATLLADYPNNTLSILRNEIEKLNLSVEVAFVGPNLEKFVKERMHANLPVLFYNWKPNSLTMHNNVSSIAFPNCEDDPDFSKSSENGQCEFEINQMEKIVWKKIKSHLPDVYHLVKALSFNQSEYLKLLENYESSYHRSAATIACKWVADNEIKWHLWLPELTSHQYTLYIGGIFPLSGEYWHQRGIAVAAQMAIDAVNNNNSILKNYKLQLLAQNGACQSDIVMKAFIGYVTNSTYNRMVGILGPACSETVEPIAGLAKHFNSIIISYSAEGSLRYKSPYFFRTIPENDLFRSVYIELFEQLKWRRFAAVTEDGQKYPEYVSSLGKHLIPENSAFFHHEKYQTRDNGYNMTKNLLQLKSNDFRIIIGEFYDNAGRAVMCEAYKQNMTAKYLYQWFLPPWFPTKWYDTDFYNTEKNESTPCTTLQMIEAINGHISLAYKFYADDNETMQSGKSVKDWKEMYEQLSNVQEKETSKYGGYAYDAVWMYAYALDALFKDDPTHVSTLHSMSTTTKLVSFLNKTDFEGVSGKVKFDNSSRTSKVIIWQWVNKSMTKIGVYTPNGDKPKLILDENKINWCNEDSAKPKDKTWHKTEISSCPFESLRSALNVTCEIALVVVNVVGFTLLVILVMVVFVMFKRRYDLKVKLTEARIRELGLLPSSGIMTLDEWEMQRDHIVINRKLGEGAFGTVYGGEAFVAEKGWVAVAVKTLKIGANIEEKLDFLSEAEMMKRFDHANIVRLLGVCTIGEPVYTVMEFMLYGDLKTYLLGRRHLVNEKGRHCTDEISDRQLTNMALDIARGLSYLAELKYVHRDLACRNCLVNANRTVKIADFGMCRPMYDSDYYRFNKRGMLPVRWMAPESLIDGLFTPSSDVWSFGVLLYEVVTFGSFPYQGLSNHHVFEYVTKYNTLSVPNGCKPELETLFLRCWKRTFSERPTANEILELLAEYPSLISPCLDMPSASVEVEDTDSMELTIHERSRLHSITSMTNPIRRVVERQNSLGPVENGGTTMATLNSDTSPVLFRTRMIPNKGQYVTLQSKNSQSSDYGSSASKDLSQGITAL